MITEQYKKLITRVQVKEILRRQAKINPGETMFDGVCPIEYGAGVAGIPSLQTIMRRVVILETWIDSQLQEE